MDSCKSVNNVTIALIVATIILRCDASADAKRLYEELLKKRGYNKLIRPVGNNSDTLMVYLGLQLSQLIDVDEKYQIITTNVWLHHVWSDYKLQWNPKEYGNIELLYVPSNEICADGNYEVTLTNTKATVRHNGRIEWTPPAIYKSSCLIDVEYFPFDTQECYMKFGSWTYDGNEVNLKHIAHLKTQSEEVERQVVTNGIDIRNYYESVEWDVLKVPAQKNKKKYPCCEEPYMDITFNITLRRKTLFYTVNLIVPCVSISFLTVLVFYLPSDSGEKITLCLSILLSLTVFFLLLAEIIPPTSLVVPLIGKYLLFTMILVTLSIIVTVCVLNVHFRSPATHTMSPWVKKVFLHILPRLLLMRRPHTDMEKARMQARLYKVGDDDFSASKNAATRSARMSTTPVASNMSRPINFANESDPILQSLQRAEEMMTRCDQCGGVAAKDMPSERFNSDVLKALEGVRFIAGHLRCEDETQQIKEDWKYVAMVLDRLFLWIFTSACIVGTLGIILQAPTLYDESEPLRSQSQNQGATPHQFRD